MRTRYSIDLAQYVSENIAVYTHTILDDGTLEDVIACAKKHKPDANPTTLEEAQAALDAYAEDTPYTITLTTYDWKPLPHVLDIVENALRDPQSTSERKLLETIEALACPEETKADTKED